MTVGYFCAIGIALVFMLYMDGQIGVMMLSFLLLMPAVSCAITWFVKRSLHISLEVQDSAAKQQKITAVVRLQKNTVLPLPFLRLHFMADAHFEPLNPLGEPLPPKPDREKLGALRYRFASRKWEKRKRSQLVPDVLPLCLSMGTARSAEYRIALTPRFCGNGIVQLQEIVLSDFLAMFRFRLKQECSTAVLVTPEIPELKANSTLFRSVSTAVSAADEETESTPNHSASAMPGYDHRDYIPGDSLKRINWKLSSKRRHLMVRQDEPIALARLSVVLDFRRDARKLPMRTRLALEEQLIETALGFLMLCARYGYPCRLCYNDSQGEWKSLAIDDGERLAVESVTLLRGGFRPAEQLEGVPRLSPEVLQESGSVLLYFTTFADPDTAAELEQYASPLYLLVPENEAPAASVPKNGSLWLVTADRRLEPTGEEG